MHELPVTQSVLEICLRHAERANARQITKINLVIGKLSSIVDDSVQFYWELIARGTIAEKAVLNFERVPVEMSCLDCGALFEPSDESFACPRCLSLRVKVTKGDEFRVSSIEIE